MDISARTKRYVAAWNAGDAQAVAEMFTPEARFVINRGDPHVGRKGIAAMAAGFFADVPDLLLTTEILRPTDLHILHAWTFTGHHAETRQRLECWRLGRMGAGLKWSR